MREIVNGNQSIEDVIDYAIINHYPEYVEAANIVGMIGDLTIGTAVYLDTYGQKNGDRIMWNPAVTLEFYGTAIDEARELSEVATSIRSNIKSSSDKAMTLIRSVFSEDLKSYYDCLGRLMDFLSLDPTSIDTNAKL